MSKTKKTKNTEVETTSNTTVDTTEVETTSNTTEVMENEEYINYFSEAQTAIANLFAVDVVDKILNTTSKTEIASLYRLFNSLSNLSVELAGKIANKLIPMMKVGETLHHDGGSIKKIIESGVHINKNKTRLLRNLLAYNFDKYITTEMLHFPKPALVEELLDANSTLRNQLGNCVVLVSDETLKIIENEATNEN